MNIGITIKEQPGGDVAVGIKSEPSMVTTREDRYATEITKSIKLHLAKEMPKICKRVLAQERN